MRKTLPKLLMLCCTTIFIARCGFDISMFNDVNTEVNLSLKLGKLEVSDSLLFAMAGDFSKDITVEEDGLLVLNLKDSLDVIDENLFQTIFNFSPSAQQIKVNIPASQIPNIPIPDATLVPLEEPIIIDVGVDMGPDVEMKEVVLASSSITMQVASGANLDLSKFKITFPSFVSQQDDKPLVITPNKTSSLTEPYVITFTQTPNTNNIKVIIDGEIPYGLIKTGTLTANISFGFDKLQSATGFFENKDVTNTTTVTYQVDEGFTEFSSMVEYLYFKDPKVMLQIDNLYNIPIIIDIATLTISDQPVEFKEGYNKFYVAPESTSTIYISNSSTLNDEQFSQLINTDFKKLELKPHAILNPTIAQINEIAEENRPQNYQQTTINSVDADKTIQLNYSIVMPFDLTMQKAHFSQAVDIDFSSLTTGDKENPIKELAFGFYGQNTMPIEFIVNAFLDQTAQIPLFSSSVVMPASTTVNQKPITPYKILKEDMMIVEVPQSVLSDVLSAKSMYFEFLGTTKNASQTDPIGSSVKVLSPSSIELNVIVGTKLELESSL